MVRGLIALLPILMIVVVVFDMREPTKLTSGKEVCGRGAAVMKDVEDVVMELPAVCGLMKCVVVV